MGILWHHSLNKNVEHIDFCPPLTKAAWCKLTNYFESTSIILNESETRALLTFHNNIGLECLNINTVFEMIRFPAFEKTNFQKY